MSACDWRLFVERHSRIEQILRQDPTDVYSMMNFATRDRYRHVIESVAAKCDLGEEEVAQMTLQLAQKATQVNHDNRGAHVGYYLIGRGRGTLERQVRMRGTVGGIASRIVRNYPMDED